MNLIPPSLLVVLSIAAAAPPPAPPVQVSHGPLVMRLAKDEFRIAFGLSGTRCLESGCHGVIRYRVSWRADDGSSGAERRQLSFAFAPRSGRSIAVDRQYFDTAEGAHTTDIVSVRVDGVCLEGLAVRAH